MTEQTRAEVWTEDEMAVASVADREVEYGEDGTGRTTYRHVITTEWRVLPSD